MARGGGRLSEGGDYLKYFGQRGAIIRGRRLIEGRLLFEEIRYPGKGHFTTFQTYINFRMFRDEFIVKKGQALGS